MGNRTVAAWCGVACVYPYVATGAYAQCASEYVVLAQLVSRDSVAIVFSGTVTNVDRTGSTETVTFDVERAWKGLAKERTTIYKPIPVALGNAEFTPTIFERRNHYIVVAHRLSAAERSDLGLTDREETFGTNVCGDGSRPFAAAEQEFAGIGPGRPPVDQRPGIRRPSITAPRRIKDVAPVYPAGALAAGVRGTVIVQITIDETGRVSRAGVLRSIPFLDQAAIDCVMKWEYLPRLIDGVPQPMTMTATVTFAP